MEASENLFSSEAASEAGADAGARPGAAGGETVTLATDAATIVGPREPESAAATEADAWGDPPYVFDECVVDLRIIMLPHDGNAAGRDIVVSVTTHDDDPLIAHLRESELGGLPAPVAALIGQLKQSLAGRGQAAVEKRNRAEEERRRAAERRNLTTKPRSALVAPARPQPSGATPTAAPPRPHSPTGVTRATTALPAQIGLFG